MADDQFIEEGRDLEECIQGRTTRYTTPVVEQELAV
jgi:hypothetical protein